MKRIDWERTSESDRGASLSRPEQRADPELREKVRSIVETVRTGGWDGLCVIAREIDGEEPQLVDVGPIAEEARKKLDPQAIAAVELAARNIRSFHEATMPNEISVETAPGLVVRKVWRPIDRVGLYVPGGMTPLFSTLLMLAIPAAVAGVKEIVAVTPPRPEGGLDPVIALAAQISGLQSMWVLGGAQAIAALAFGAGGIPRADKICGPGNAFVAEAKRVVSSLPGGPAIDMPAGPSELMVIADESGDPSLIAADLLSQAEHDRQAQVLLVTTSARLAGEVEAAMEAQLESLPRRRTALQSLGSARVIIASTIEQAVEISNLYAPEHLSLALADADRLLPLIRNAGAIFAGRHAAETFGDYLAGSSHVLPTDGAARAWGGVSPFTFLKALSVQTVTPEAARRLAGPAAILARIEGLEAHARAADARKEAAA